MDLFSYLCWMKHTHKHAHCELGKWVISVEGSGYVLWHSLAICPTNTYQATYFFTSIVNGMC